MAEPSRARNFFGKVVDRILPGTNYNTQTGQYSNIGTGALGLAARLAATSFAGPAVGALVGKGASYLIDRNGSPVQAPDQSAQVQGAPTAAFTAPTLSNLGLGAQSPGNSWQGYMQSPGATSNFGNTQFGNGMAGIPGSWGAQSQWGQNLTAQPAAPGSTAGFGNNVQGFAGGGGGGGGSSSGGGRVGGGMPGIFGGRPANDGMLEIRQRWANK